MTLNKKQLMRGTLEEVNTHFDDNASGVRLRSRPIKRRKEW